MGCHWPQKSRFFGRHDTINQKREIQTMFTPVIIVCILLVPLIGAWTVGGRDKAAMGGLFGISIAFIFFGIGHFAQTDGMIAMLPEILPARRQIVLATGVLELAIAVGFLVPATKRLAGLAAIAVLIGFFPANIYAAVNHTGMGGHVWGPEYLLIRFPLQVLLVVLTWTFVVRRKAETRAPVIL